MIYTLKSYKNSPIKPPIFVVLKSLIGQVVTIRSRRRLFSKTFIRIGRFYFRSKSKRENGFKVLDLCSSGFTYLLIYVLFYVDIYNKSNKNSGLYKLTLYD